jgi:hypothetical protein
MTVFFPYLCIDYNDSHPIRAKEEQISYLMKNTHYLFTLLPRDGKKKLKIKRTSVIWNLSHCNSYWYREQLLSHCLQPLILLRSVACSLITPQQFHRSQHCTALHYTVTKSDRLADSLTTFECCSTYLPCTELKTDWRTHQEACHSPLYRHITHSKSFRMLLGNLCCQPIGFPSIPDDMKGMHTPLSTVPLCSVPTAVFFLTPGTMIYFSVWDLSHTSNTWGKVMMVFWWYHVTFIDKIIMLLMFCIIWTLFVFELMVTISIKC